MRAFAAASESMGKPAFTIGRIAPHLVDQFFNDSTGQGDHGEIDARGPWNEGGQWEFVEAPAFQEIRGTETDSPPIHVESSEPTDVEAIQELLVDQLHDILHADKQVLKAPQATGPWGNQEHGCSAGRYSTARGAVAFLLFPLPKPSVKPNSVSRWSRARFNLRRACVLPVRCWCCTRISGGLKRPVCRVEREHSTCQCS